MTRYRRLIGVCMFLPFIVVALVSSGDDAKEEKPGARTVVKNLLDPAATLRDYRAAPRAEQDRFVAQFTATRLGDAEPVAMAELRRHLDSRLASLPAHGDSMEVLKAGTGRTPLWEAAEYAAENLGWPER